MNPFIGPAEREAYVRALDALSEARLPFLVGGAYAMFHYTGMCRQTKDLDLFLRRRDEPHAREILDAAGFQTEIREPQWLSKAYSGELFIDLIHSSGNGVASVDDLWIEHAPCASVLDQAVRLVPPEEMIWSKAYVQERERFDGADVLHLVRACGSTMDWRRLVARFDSHWQVLLAHLSLYSFSYPHDRDRVPQWVWRTLLDRAKHEKEEPEGEEKVCRGTLLSRVQFLPDVGLWGYRDARELEVPGFEPPPEAEVRAPRFAAHPSAADQEERLAAAMAPDA